jgi:hypothetical protein
MKVSINETTLTNIGAAIREKTGKTDLIAPGDMPAEIRAIESGGGGGVDVEPIVLTGDCDQACKGPLSTTYLSMFGDTVSTNDISSAIEMFMNSSLTKIPFALNFKSSLTTSARDMLHGMTNLTELPIINGFRPFNLTAFFDSCYNIVRIPEDYFDNWDWRGMNSSTTGASVAGVFARCYGLRNVPIGYTKNAYNTAKSTSYSPYNNTYYLCYSLDELKEVAVNKGLFTSNAFSYFVGSCARLKELTFATNDDGTPVAIAWKAQTIDLTTIGYISSAGNAIAMKKYSPEITDDTMVSDAASYAALKDDPNWWTSDIAYSRYNHDSAVNTINSLPDCSGGSGNTIKFKGAAGSATDGGAINTLTEEEIAVATAKGWTITFI